MKNINKSKLVARVMLTFVIFMTMLVISCQLPIEEPVILDNTLPNLDEQNVSYLLLRDLRNSEYINDIDYFYYETNGGFEIKEGEYIYIPAIMEVSAGFDGEGFHKRSYFFYLSKNISMSIMGCFYPVKGDIEKLEYEFKYVDSSPYKYNRVVYIHSNSQLVGKFYYYAQKFVKENWIEDFLNENLILMTVKKYTDTDKVLNNTSSDNIVSYLSLGNISNSQYCSEIMNYTTHVNGGTKIEHGSEYYSDISNLVNIEFKGDKSIDEKNISVQAEFYAYKGILEELRYEFSDMSEDKSVEIAIYNGNVTVGTLSIICEEEISNEWICSFLNENLIITEIKDR